MVNGVQNSHAPKKDLDQEKSSQVINKTATMVNNNGTNKTNDSAGLDVMDDIESMLANLSNQLDQMLTQGSENSNN